MIDINYKISSVLSDCDLATACFRILHFFDPNRGKNRKTKILNDSNIHLWSENEIQLYDITNTKNLGGYVKSTEYDIIIYEPPYNQKIISQSIEAAKIFQTVLSNKGFVLCKVNDFKIGKSEKLVGSFEVQQSFQNAEFMLVAKIIYHHTNKYNQNIIESTDKVNINHSSFLIFRKRIL